MKRLGLEIPEILIPASRVDFDKWGVIACDQFTQNEAYWKNLQEEIGNAPSTLKMILPEFFLNKPMADRRRENTVKTMDEYLAGNIFSPAIKSMLLVKRTTPYGRARKGIIVAVDLEEYDFSSNSKSKIRPTEATISERLPPRREIRIKAPLEIPHIILLANDKGNLLFSAAEKAAATSPLFEANLTAHSGTYTGWKIEDTDVLNEAAEILSRDKNFFLAVGDGNHSLAAAKAVWNMKKQEGAPPSSPYRYALAEIVNIFDCGLVFEPIHRVIFHCSAGKLRDFLSRTLQPQICEKTTEEAMKDFVHVNPSSFGFIYEKNGEKQFYSFLLKDTSLLVANLQSALDDFLRQEGGEIDFVHGENDLLSLRGDKTVCFFLPPIHKETFFETINKRGSLPRKSFSLGQPEEKRFYFECRRLA